MMNTTYSILQKGTLVSDVLAACPPTVAFFLQHRLDCVGCRMAGFCTLEDVCEHYSLEIEWLLAELAALVQPEQGSPAVHSKGETK
jgi:hybrid cluster-associated redox disulfide protein